MRNIAAILTDSLNLSLDKVLLLDPPGQEPPLNTRADNGSNWAVFAADNWNDRSEKYPF